MENNEKVFSSEILINENGCKNNLYDLLIIDPAKPLDIKNEKNYTCDFVPKTDKFYVPKRISKEKVRTVRDIRALFEYDTNFYLSSDLKSQQNYLLKKITDGCLRNENTRNIAKKIFNGSAPISRPAWQMLININPENHVYPRQYVLWNGKLIQVNGSHGGNKKILCNCDVPDVKLLSKSKKRVVKNNIQNKRKGLLKNSLAIKFKPGPLGRKKFLDDSHQKHHGNIELLNLPKVGLLVQPMYGTMLEPTITHFLSNLRDEDGTISKKWAEFAVSVLGKNDCSNVKLVDNACLTFDLKYKCDQHRILMRKDLDSTCIVPRRIKTCETSNVTTNQHGILPEITEMMNKILDTVEISINQDNMYTTNESFDTIVKDSTVIDTPTYLKEKAKKRYNELDRLDVTVIQLPETIQKDSSHVCGNAYCSMGCLCDSLKKTYNFKGHCGREECMFDCKCDFSKYTCLNSLQMGNPDLLPGIINIEDEINMRLAKEEQKFHQTVIVTGENNILFKSEKRNWKSSKKYETFYKNMCLKNVDEKIKLQRELSISLFKLNFDNIEPWCMVHNLYKCFCKGRFTESASMPLPKENIVENPRLKEPFINAGSDFRRTEKLNNSDASVKTFMRKRAKRDVSSMHKSMSLDSLREKSLKNSSALPKPESGTVRSYLSVHRKFQSTADTKNKEDSASKTYEDSCVSESGDSLDYWYSEYNDTCSRVNAYNGRKYSNGHYKNTNYRIKEMEQNDKNLHIRLMSILNIEAEKRKEDILGKHLETTAIPVKNIQTTAILEENNEEITTAAIIRPPDMSSIDSNLAKFLADAKEMIQSSNDGEISKPLKRKLSSENKLVGWVESSYKLYKKRHFKSSLSPPQVGKVVMHSWEFILSRYRERKNLFLISKQAPYRIFMGVHTNNPFFASCMNINEIRFADLHKYPQTVKNLLTNATDLKDNFCILRGLPHCWELFGSVTKVNKNDENTEDLNDDTSDIDSFPQSSYSDIPSSSDEQLSFGCAEQSDSQTDVSKEHLERNNSIEHVDESESSKWFAMTVENDFTEIRFYKRGFFVKYESIVKAINVARMSGKTVRLSSQKCVDKNNGPQFGVYAIPNTSEYCVFIGPYDMQDSLGIETIKTVLDVRKTKRTRGFWINTNKIDNIKVIDNPLSFMPIDGLENSETVPLDSHFLGEDKIINQENVAESVNIKESEANKTVLSPTKKNTIKPIKIRKTNGFYHLATDGSLKKITLQSPPKIVSINTPILSSMNATSSNIVPNTKILLENLSGNNSNQEPDTEKGPQLKISAIYSQKEDPKPNSKKPERGMLVLKPEEINKRLFEGQIKPDSISPIEDEDIVREIETNVAVLEYPLFRDDLENSATLAPSTSNTDVYVISDDEDDTWKNVYIQCTNVKDIGWVNGKQKIDSRMLSFQLPGSQFSDFYDEDDAFIKLNEELASVIQPREPLDLAWKVVGFKQKVGEEIILGLCEVLYRESKKAKLPKTFMKTYVRKSATPSPGPSDIEMHEKTDMLNMEEEYLELDEAYEE